jgi:hypothetical protein
VDLPLHHDPKGRQLLATRLYRDFYAMKTYGKEPESLESIVSLFNETLAGYPLYKINAALVTHAQRSQEFPTPADIVGLIRRNGRPPLSEARFVAISRKDGADRTPEEWQYLRDWEADRDDGWADEPGDEKIDNLRADNASLRQHLREAQDEIRRLGRLALERREEQRRPFDLTRPALTREEKVARTVEEMRRAGAPEEDISAFLASAA